MDSWEQTKLSSLNIPILEEGEMELKVVDNISIYEGYLPITNEKYK